MNIKINNQKAVQLTFQMLLFIILAIVILILLFAFSRTQLFNVRDVFTQFILGPAGG
jgi:hypothetical protein